VVADTAVPELRQQYEDRASALLRFDANDLAGCVAATTDTTACRFADISLATGDATVPLIAVAFKRDLGGANAQNWTEARLLLDFRESQPGVAATIDCDYNEGGGACTAIDSGMAPRFGFGCEWVTAVADFRCTQRSETQHRDFYLLTARDVPLRENEFASIEDALAHCLGRGTGRSCVVRGLGEVTVIDDFAIRGGRRAIVLASGGTLYLATKTTDAISSIRGMTPRGLVGDAATTQAPASGWTLSNGAKFTAKRIYRDDRVTVVQIVDSLRDEANALYWY
jgi:hypothetical protein